jgi:DNA gyrase subunit A
MGRATQGVRLIKVKDDDAIAAVAKVMHDEDEIVVDDDTVEGDENQNGTTIDNDNAEIDNNE